MLFRDSASTLNSILHYVSQSFVNRSLVELYFLYTTLLLNDILRDSQQDTFSLILIISQARAYSEERRIKLLGIGFLSTFLFVTFAKTKRITKKAFQHKRTSGRLFWNTTSRHFQHQHGHGSFLGLSAAKYSSKLGLKVG